MRSRMRRYGTPVRVEEQLAKTRRYEAVKRSLQNDMLLADLVLTNEGTAEIDTSQKGFAQSS